MKKLVGLVFIVIFFIPAILNSQARKSKLLVSLNSAREDTVKAQILMDLAFEISKSDPDSAITVAHQACKLSEKLKWKRGMANSLSDLGIYNRNIGNNTEALEFCFRSMKINKEIGNKVALSSNLGNLGNLYAFMGNYSEALNYLNEAIKIFRETGDKKREASALATSGLVYSDQGNYPLSLEYYFKALKINEAIGEKEDQAINYSNMANIFRKLEDYDKSLEYHDNALKIFEGLGEKGKIAAVLGNKGSVYYTIGNKSHDTLEKRDNFKTALEYYLKSLRLNEEMGRKSGILVQLANIGNLYSKMAGLEKNTDKRNEMRKLATDYTFKTLEMAKQQKDLDKISSVLNSIGYEYYEQKKFKEAEVFFNKALKLADSINALPRVVEIYQNLFVLHQETGNYKLALQEFKDYVFLRDSIFNETNTKKNIRLEMNFDFEKKEAIAKADFEKQKAIDAVQLEKQRLVTYGISAGGLLVLAFLILAIRGYRQKQKANIEITQQKLLVEKQKHLVEEHQKEIIDSITYAKRLQQAILPPPSFINQHLKDNFILYKPKDIVAGDFYWMEVVGDTILIAAADSTGHGVPGAMVSVVCSNALNRAVKEFGLTEPGKILDKTRELVLETFSKSEGEVKDGMDISLLSIKKQTIKWSGANNQLWYTDETGFREVTANKQPIGKTDNSQSFTTHEIDCPKGGTFYLLTDGYPDQFGGPKGKKFKYRQLQEFLMALNEKPLDLIKQSLESEFEKWKGDLEQVDDVTIIGIRV
jgi:tetratricopeptide (TPR) repeat protein